MIVEVRLDTEIIQKLFMRLMSMHAFSVIMLWGDICVFVVWDTLACEWLTKMMDEMVVSKKQGSLTWVLNKVVNL